MTWPFTQDPFLLAQHIDCLLQYNIFYCWITLLVFKSNFKMSFLFCSNWANNPYLTNSTCLCLFTPSAIYLCKRTMQNKARLELADYEAVSTRSFELTYCQEAPSTVFSLMWRRLCMNFTKTRVETASSGPSKCQNSNVPAKQAIKLQTFIQMCENQNSVQ